MSMDELEDIEDKTGVSEGGSDRQAIVKVHTITYDESVKSNAFADDDSATVGMWEKAGVIPPPYSPSWLSSVFEQSNCLRQNVEAYVTNCEQFGYRLEPILDIDSPDVDKKIGDIIYLERLAEAEDQGLTDVKEATEQEIATRKQLITTEMRKEKARVEAFFQYCCDRISFVELRSRTRSDLEVTGNAYWECLRNKLGKLVEIKHIPSYTMRIVAGGTQTTAKVRLKITPITYKEVEKSRRLRKFVQICDGTITYFKEFGDVRVMSSKTGQVFESVDALKAKESGVAPATEVMEFKIYSSRGPYGLPRWIGNLKSALGSIETEDMNLVFFQNDSMPPMAIMVEGGRLQKGAEASLKNLMRKETRGTKNKFKTLILEASASDTSASATADGKVRIKIQPLTQSMIKDGLFMAYDQKNRDKIGESFRLPKILRGDSSDVNRATADAAISLAEQQVFSSIRNSFDYKMDREIFTDLEVRYFEFESLGPDLKNADSIATAVKAFAGSLKGNEVRKIAGDVFGRQFQDTDEAWGNVPLALALAGVGDAGADGTETAIGATKALEEGNSVALAAHMAKLRKMIHAAEGTAAAKEFAVEKKAAEAPEEHIIQVPAELLAKWVQLD